MDITRTVEINIRLLIRPRLLFVEDPSVDLCGAAIWQVCWTWYHVRTIYHGWFHCQCEQVCGQPSDTEASHRRDRHVRRNWSHATVCGRQCTVSGHIASPGPALCRAKPKTTFDKATRQHRCNYERTSPGQTGTGPECVPDHRLVVKQANAWVYRHHGTLHHQLDDGVCNARMQTLYWSPYSWEHPSAVWRNCCVVRHCRKDNKHCHRQRIKYDESLLLWSSWVRWCCWRRREWRWWWHQRWEHATRRELLRTTSDHWAWCLLRTYDQLVRERRPTESGTAHNSRAGNNFKDCGVCTKIRQRNWSTCLWKASTACCRDPLEFPACHDQICVERGAGEIKHSGHCQAHSIWAQDPGRGMWGVEAFRGSFDLCAAGESAICQSSDPVCARPEVQTGIDEGAQRHFTSARPLSFCG